jgi:hypothetical protein
MKGPSAGSGISIDLFISKRIEPCQALLLAGSATWPGCATRMKKRIQSASWNRKRPVSSSYSRQPSAHTSAAGPAPTARRRSWLCRAAPAAALPASSISGLFTNSVPRFLRQHVAWLLQHIAWLLQHIA